jgi:hypothetical protein
MTKKATTAELVARYREGSRAQGRQRFSNRPTAEKRVAAIEAELKPKNTKGAYDPDALGKKRGLRFDLPGRKDKVPPREGTMRAKLLGMAQDAGKKGIDFEELHAACGFKNRKSTRDALGLLSRKNGYGIKGTAVSVKLA